MRLRSYSCSPSRCHKLSLVEIKACLNKFRVSLLNFWWLKNNNILTCKFITFVFNVYCKLIYFPFDNNELGAGVDGEAENELLLP